MNWSLFFLIIFSTSAFAINRVEGICDGQSLVSCQRQGDLEELKNYLRRHPDMENIARIYDQRQEILSARGALMRTSNSPSYLLGEQGCDCNHFGPALANLVNFIQQDSPDIIEALLQSIPTDDIARNARLAVEQGCGQSSLEKRRELFRHARAAYDANQESAIRGIAATPKATITGNNTDLRFYEAETSAGEVLFSFAGSQTAADWESNILHSGADQLEEALDSAAFTRAVEYVKQGKKINCTGHSLGGGLAEGFCLSVLAEVKRSNSNFGRRERDNLIQITTFNALGSRGMCQNPRIRRAGAPRSLLPNLNHSRCGSPSDRDWAVSSADHVRIRGDFIPRYTPHDVSSYMVGNVTRIESGLQMPIVVPQNMSPAPGTIFQAILPAQQNRSPYQVRITQDRCDNDPVNAHSLECIAHAIAPVSRTGVAQRCRQYDSQNAGWVQVPSNSNNLMSNGRRVPTLLSRN